MIKNKKVVSADLKCIECRIKMAAYRSNICTNCLEKILSETDGVDLVAAALLDPEIAPAKLKGLCGSCAR